MTNIYLITGFLGAGKTTFLNYRLAQAETKVGVLMNEFGKVSMDTLAVNKNDIDFVELKNGSIFCSCLKTHFIDGLTKLVEMNLNEIYIESSGLSDPSDMNKVIDVLGKTIGNDKFSFKGTICIVDGVFFKPELEKMVNVERQILHSHHILINKTDLISAEVLQETVDIIKNLNPKVKITPIIHGQVDFESLDVDYFYIEDEDSTNTVESKPRTAILKFVQEPSVVQLRKFLEEVHSHFHRIKGFILIEGQWYKIDGVNSQLEIQIFNEALIDHEFDGLNELVLLSSKGISSISHLSIVADRVLNGIYKLQM